MRHWSKDDVARIIIDVGEGMGITERGIVIGLSVGLVESNLTVYANAKVDGSLELPHDAVGSDGMSVGVQQQQVVMGNGWWWGPVQECQDPTSSSKLFFERLAKLDYNNGDPGRHAQAIQGSAFPHRYAQRMGEAQEIYDRLKTGGDVTVPETPTATGDHPDYNEFPIWSANNSDRGGTTVDAFFLHTQEAGGGDDAAMNLANWFKNSHEVSYHYTVSQASDGGVTVVDCVDTDRMAWSVLSANQRSINLCFAGSRAAWSRDQWMKQSKAIDVAAYIAVQDCRKYHIPIHVVPPPYTGRIPGISDHRYVTKVLGDGTHTDVGDNFPWDYFIDRVTFWTSGSDVPAKPTSKRFPQDWTDRDLLIEILRQQRGATLEGWPQMGGRTAVDYLVHLGQKIDAIATTVEKLT